MNLVELSICIVNWNGKEYIDACLRSLEKISDAISYEVIVVDNASSDGSCDWIHDQFPHVKLIENKENLGFATANNQALKVAQGQSIFLLNPDTELVAGAVEELLQFLDNHSNVAIVAPKLLNSDGTLQRSVRQFPGFKIAFYRYTFLKKIGIFSRADARNKMSGFSFNEEKSVEQPAGAALMIRREILDAVGGMDPTFFLFYEEVDLCRRIKKRGYEIYFDPKAEVVHHQGKARQKNRQQIFLPTLRSLFYYLSKHYGEKKTKLFKWGFKPLFVISTLLDIVEEILSSCLYALKKDTYRSNRQKEKYQLKLNFLCNDLFEFLFKT